MNLNDGSTSSHKAKMPQMDLEQFQNIVDVIKHCGGLMRLDVSLIQMGYKALTNYSPIVQLAGKISWLSRTFLGPTLGPL